jgi:hypothetical protein
LIAGELTPSPRSYHACAEVWGSFIAIHGGNDGDNDLADVHLLDASSMLHAGPQIHKSVFWIRPNVVGDVPTRRRFHTLTSHQRSGMAVMLGGCEGPRYKPNMDVRVMRLILTSTSVQVEWVSPVIQGTAPSPRWGHTANFVNDDMVVFGGRNTADLNDIHVLRLLTFSSSGPITMSWTTCIVKMNVPGHIITPRRRPATVVVNNNVIIFGGFDGTFFNDIHALKLINPTGSGAGGHISGGGYADTAVHLNSAPLSVEHMVDFLKALDLDEHYSKFEAAQVDLEALLLISSPNDLSDLGIPLGHRIKIHAAVRKLRGHVAAEDLVPLLVVNNTSLKSVIKANSSELFDAIVDAVSNRFGIAPPAAPVTPSTRVPVAGGLSAEQIELRRITLELKK